MQEICIDSWLNKKEDIATWATTLGEELELNFANVNELKLSDIEEIVTLQKLAVFNDSKISVKNMTPTVSRVFEQTGLYKMMNNFASNNMKNIRKRQGFAFE